MDCKCGKPMLSVATWEDQERRSHCFTVHYCESCGTICREDIWTHPGLIWIALDQTVTEERAQNCNLCNDSGKDKCSGCHGSGKDCDGDECRTCSGHGSKPCVCLGDDFWKEKRGKRCPSANAATATER